MNTKTNTQYVFIDENSPHQVDVWKSRPRRVIGQGKFRPYVRYYDQDINASGDHLFSSSKDDVECNLGITLKKGIVYKVITTTDIEEGCFEPEVAK